MSYQLAAPFPEIAFISQCFTDTFSGAEHLFPAEAAIIERVSDKRRADFSTGRYCARQALQRFTDSNTEILRGENNQPLWPVGITGSISHSKKLAGAVVAQRGDVVAIGLDIETIGGVKPDMWRLIFHSQEQEIINSKGSEADIWATLLFSLKESFYKLQSPLTGLFLDFSDVLISTVDGKISISITNPQKNLGGLNLNDVEMRWTTSGDQLISLCYIPNTKTIVP